MCFDEFGPVQVRPQAGSAWAPKGRPIRRRATYRRTLGVRYFFAAYDVHEDVLWMHQRRRKRTGDVLLFLKTLRARYPHRRRICLVLDNLSTHNGREVKRYCRASNIMLVYTATYASWMNRIECHFAPFRQFVLDNSDHADHRELARAAQHYLRWRNSDKKNQKIVKAQNSIRTL